MLTQPKSFDAAVQECNNLPFCSGITKHTVDGYGAYYTTHKSTTLEHSYGNTVWLRGHCSAIGGVHFCDGDKVRANGGERDVLADMRNHIPVLGVAPPQLHALIQTMNEFKK